MFCFYNKLMLLEIAIPILNRVNTQDIDDNNSGKLLTC